MYDMISNCLIIMTEEVEASGEVERPVIGDVAVFETRYAMNMQLKKHNGRKMCTYDPIVLGFFLEIETA